MSTYYTVDELQSSKDMGNFNIFHNNLNRLENNFLEYMETILSKVSNENKEIYICGDFNSEVRK